MFVLCVRNAQFCGRGDQLCERLLCRLGTVEAGRDATIRLEVRLNPDVLLQAPVSSLLATASISVYFTGSEMARRPSIASVAGPRVKQHGWPRRRVVHTVCPRPRERLSVRVAKPLRLFQGRHGVVLLESRAVMSSPKNDRHTVLEREQTPAAQVGDRSPAR